MLFSETIIPKQSSIFQLASCLYQNPLTPKSLSFTPKKQNFFYARWNKNNLIPGKIDFYEN